MAGDDPRSPGAGAALASFGLFTLALCVRLLPWPFIFQPNGTTPYGNDPFYHLRRIQYSVANFPDVLDFDPYINFPHGAQPIWPPTLDWLIAGLLRLIVGPNDPDGVERLAVLLPPIAGAATVVLLYWIARRFYSGSTALLAAIVLALLPAHFFYSQIGLVDHHVFVAFVATGMLGCMMALLAARDRAWRQSAILGLAMAAAILLWPGSLIHVGIVQVAMVVRLLSAETRSDATAWGARFALANLVAMLCVLPLSAGNEWIRWGPYRADVLSNFQPLYFAAASSCFALSWLLWSRGTLAADRRVRAMVAVSAGGLLMGLLLAAIPALREALFDAWAWLAKTEEFQAAVSESSPLLADFTTVHQSRSTALFTVFLYVVPLALALLAWRTWHEPRRAERLFFVWWATALFVATLVQWRFMNSYSIAHALLLALVVEDLRRRVAPRLAGQPALRPAAVVVAVALAIYVFTPVWLNYRPYLDNLRRSASGEKPVMNEYIRRHGIIVETARWLARNSPPPDEGPYSVLGPWGDGHILKYAAGRPIVQDNFGDDVAVENFALAEAYFAATHESDALAILEKTKTRYVLVRATGSGHGRGEYTKESMAVRLFKTRGAAGATHPALERHQLIFESPRARTRSRTGEPVTRIFEIVEGARLEGLADPGARVLAGLELESRFGGRFRYTASAIAGADGRYRLVLPYPNERFSSNVQVAGRYALRSGEMTGFVSISKETVQRGARVEGPTLRSACPSRPGAS